MSDCIFCKISAGAIPAKKLAENSFAFIIADIGAQAKKHFLVIPKVHVESLATAFSTSNEGKAMVGELFALAVDFANKEGGLLPGGFRSVINTGSDGGQSVHHLHLHLLGGEKLKGTFA